MLWSILYSLIAGVSDFYFLSFVLAATAALGTVVLQRPIPLPILILLLVSSILVTILHHAIFAKRVSWLTPGEHLVGRVVENGSKEWKNPYGRNRWALFLTILLTIVSSSNAWDGLGMGGVYVLNAALARIALLAALYYGLVQVGRGQLRYMLYPIGFYVILHLLRLGLQTPDPKVQSFYIALFIIGIVMHGLVALAYHFLRHVER